MYYYENKPIKQWVVEDRPREKMISRGKEALTDAELLATIIASGTRRQSALDLARMLLLEYDNLSRLSQASVNELCRFSGIGHAKASSIAAAFELARRGAVEDENRTKFLTSEDLGRYLCAKVGNQAQEVFHVMFLDNHCQIICERELFRGGRSFTAVDSKFVMKEAITHQASRIVVCHNHPSGSITPSKADDDITTKLVSYGMMVEVEVIDHIIVTKKKWYSYSDVGEMGKIKKAVGQTLKKAAGVNRID